MTIAIERRVRYRVADFSYIVNVADDPSGLWVAASSPHRSLQDLLAAARQAPDTVTLGTTGIGSDDHLLQVSLEEASPGVRFVHVPYAGTAPMQTALLGDDYRAAVLVAEERLREAWKRRPWRDQ